MRLLNAQTHELQEYTGKDVPKYAILSHRWEEEEVSFQDLNSPTYLTKKGYEKIKSACRLTLQYGLGHLWIDTCCIDKGSSAELAEAINSMYRWYAGAAVCFAYLCDVQLPKSPIRESAWFSRGWTLQELIAPRWVHFYDTNWKFLGTKEGLIETLADTTRIDESVLSGRREPSSCSIAQRMSWAARRVTTRIEDRAYSLLGLFNVNMPLLYGEEDKAFMRLQEEIIRNSDDRSIFAWDRGFEVYEDGLCGLLATSVSQFSECQSVISSRDQWSQDSALSHTALGLSIEMLTYPWSMETFLAILDCSLIGRPDATLGIFVERLVPNSAEQQYARVQVDGVTVMVLSQKQRSNLRDEQVRRLHVRRTLTHRSPNTWYGFYLKTLTLPGYTDAQLSQAQVYTRKADGRVSLERGDLLSIPHGMRGTVAVCILPQAKRGDGRIAWLQFGFNEDFAPWCQLGRRGSKYDYANIEDFFRNGCMEKRLSGWGSAGYLMWQGSRRKGLKEDIRFKDTKLSIQKRKFPTSAILDELGPMPALVWTIEIEAMEVTKEFLRKRRRDQKLADGIGTIFLLLGKCCVLAPVLACLYHAAGYTGKKLRRGE